MKTDPVKLSEEYFESGYGCAESVLMAIAVSQNIKSELIPRIASGFCGGMALTNGLCGAVAGGVMAINLIYGRDNNRQNKDINYQKVQEFISEFKARFGSLNCPDLTDCDLSTDEGKEKFDVLNVHKKCTQYTVEATRLVYNSIKSI
jgi:C_GCAxxG_C_C family probable redox protein